MLVAVAEEGGRGGPDVAGVGGRSRERNLYVGLELVGRMVVALSILLDGLHDQLAVVPQRLGRVLQAAPASPHGLHHDGAVAPQPLRGVLDDRGVDFHQLKDEVSIGLERVGGVGEHARPSTAVHGNQNDCSVPH